LQPLIVAIIPLLPPLKVRVKITDALSPHPTDSKDIIDRRQKIRPQLPLRGDGRHYQQFTLKPYFDLFPEVTQQG